VITPTRNRERVPGYTDGKVYTLQESHSQAGGDTKEGGKGGGGCCKRWPNAKNRINMWKKTKSTHEPMKTATTFNTKSCPPLTELRKA
jgi:hypothetical protein